jgi:hypothetical protein
LAGEFQELTTASTKAYYGIAYFLISVPDADPISVPLMREGCSELPASQPLADLRVPEMLGGDPALQLR